MPPSRAAASVYGGAYRGVVADVGLEADQRLGHAGGVEVEDGHRRALRGQRPGRGQPDAGRRRR